MGGHGLHTNFRWFTTAWRKRSGHIWPQKTIYRRGGSFFALASLLCGLAQTGTQLILARAVQGMTGALMSPVALSIVLSEFREGKERNKAMGVWAAARSAVCWAVF
jgi:MFS family permease